MNILLIVLTVFILLAAILVLVVVHELGHFLMAKKFGMKVLEFGFGIPPRIFGKKFGETLVSLNWLPIGGFVQILGEDESGKEQLSKQDKKEWATRSFASRPVSQRIIVVVAGVVMNLLLAFVIYYGILISQGFKYQMNMIFPYKFVGATQTNQEQVFVSETANDSPAMKAGIKQGDQITKVNNQSVISAQQVIDLTKSNVEKPLQLTLISSQSNIQREVTLVPRANPPAGQGALGVSLATVGSALIEYKEPWQKILAGPIQSYNMVAVSFSAIGQLFNLSVQEKSAAPLSAGVGGPIAIGVVSYLVLQGPDAALKFLDLVALLSLSLAIFNVLPIPALDGGRLFFLLIEAIFKKKVNPDLERKIHAVGMVVLLCLMVLIALKDTNSYILHR